MNRFITNLVISVLVGIVAWSIAHTVINGLLWLGTQIGSITGAI